MQGHHGRLMSIVLCVVVLSQYALGQEDNAVNQSNRRPFLKVDAYHSHTWLEAVPKPQDVDYHLLHGPSLALQSLVARGWRCEAQLGPWTEESLRGVDAIFFNLVSADRPPFLVDEIEALSKFVHGGGGLMLITDHSNCYFHTHVLGALAERLDIRLRTETACDAPPFTLSVGQGWLAISKFSEHEITKGLRHIAFQSGGLVDPRYGIAFLSSNGWGDMARIPAYGAKNAPGFYGDFLRQRIEEQGSLPVVSAQSVGKGRVVVIADQNCIGGMFINYADNRLLWHQAMDWIVGQASSVTSSGLASSGDASQAIDRFQGRSLLWCYEALELQRYQYGNDRSIGMYHFFAWLNKVADARATDRPLHDALCMLIPTDQWLSEEKVRTACADYIQLPKRNLIFFCKQPDALDVSRWTEQQGGMRCEVPKEQSLDGMVLGVWRLDNASHVIAIQRADAWTNKLFTIPETTADRATTRLQESFRSFMASYGVQLESIQDNVPEFEEE